MNKVRLIDICQPKQWKTIPTSQLTKEGYPVYGANGKIGFYSEYNHENETILITCRGATCGSLNISEPFSYVNGNAMCLDDLDDSVSLKYLYYNLCGYNFAKVISGTAQPQITGEGLSKVYLNIHYTYDQERIVRIFDELERVISSHKQYIQKLDELIKSRFVEMFGDLIENDRQWDNYLLCNIADIVSGITKGRKVKETELIEVPYMAVSNVKDGYIDWTTVKTILATVSEIEQYHIQPEDILMTEGGDPDKLGRGAIIHHVPENCIHQNHIFRVRLDETFILPLYFSEYLQAQKAKRYFFSCAKQTTGIASINMKQLKALPVLVPPLELQNQFADFVTQVEKQKVTVQQSINKLETLKKSLMQEYFG